MFASVENAILTARPPKGDDDFWRVRELLVETYSLTQLGFNWDVRRWDGRRFYNAETGWNPTWEARYHLWESTEGRVVAAAHPEGEGEVHLQVHPDFRSLEEQMLAWAETTLAVPDATGAPGSLTIYVYEYDISRQSLLARRGYVRLPAWGVARRMRLDDRRLPEPQVPGGYTLRATRPGEPEEGERIAALLNAAFERDWHTAAEYMNFTRLTPCFRQELDLVAVAPGGEFAAYVGVPLDEENRRGIFEPVCTHPDHRQKGLAKALMIEGLHRLRALSALEVTVETGSMDAANGLYDSLGFSEVERCYAWRKRSP